MQVGAQANQGMHVVLHAPDRERLTMLVAATCASCRVHRREP